ncbi:unnamed protein product [Allacma fusca]|uniref:Uncharacterized protein n=1 Tax=Allacma fusca TaxID=39272 RepID=A0A8J2PN12_9HEXA|nr:unnamed protein product [Allacma fusca]
MSVKKILKKILKSRNQVSAHSKMMITISVGVSLDVNLNTLPLTHPCTEILRTQCWNYESIYTPEEKVILSKADQIVAANEDELRKKGYFGRRRLVSENEAVDQNRRLHETTDYSKIYGECEERFVAQLEDNYEDAFIQMSDFFKSTNTAFVKINKRLDRIESDNAKIKINTANTTNPETFLKSLPPPANGHFFRGSTFERIAAALPSLSLAVKFVKYMDTDLTGYQLGDSWGLVHANAPTSVPSQTAQVATFKSDSDGDDGIVAQILEDPMNPLKSIDVRQM